MKIEIIDRAHWLDRVDTEIRRIATERKRRDVQFEDEWAASIFCGRLLRLIWPDAKPARERRLARDYPSIYAWEVYGTLLDMRTALRSTGTGAIFFGNAEVNAAPPIKLKPASINGDFSAHVHCAIDHF